MMPELEPPKTGIKSVRAGALLAQGVVALVVTIVVRQHLLSQEMADKLKDSPYYLMLIEYLAQGFTFGMLALQTWIAHKFINISGMIAQTKLEQIGEVKKQEAIAQNPNPPQTANAEVTEKSEMK
jgi:hypothetical protein